MTAVALLLGAGEGTRLAGVRSDAQPKAFVRLGGRPLFEHSLLSMSSSGVIDRAILVAPSTHLDMAIREVEELGWAGLVESVVAGGRTRQESVRRGLRAVGDHTAAVICHDAARPLASPDLFRRVVAGLGEADGVVPVVPIADTVKRVRAGLVIETVPREELALVQTPQGFLGSVLNEAHRAAAGGALDATDDAMLVEAAGFRVAVVAGEPSNFKVTTEEDLARAEQFLASRDALGRSVPDASIAVDGADA